MRNFKLQDTRNLVASLVIKRKKKKILRKNLQNMEILKRFVSFFVSKRFSIHIRNHNFVFFKFNSNFQFSKYISHWKYRALCIIPRSAGIINRMIGEERGNIWSKGRRSANMHRHRRYFDATLRCPVVNESENKLVGRFHRKMQFTPFMEPGPSRACVCIYACMNVRARARIETGDLGASTTADT